MGMWDAAERRGFDPGWVQVVTLAVTETTSYGVLSFAFTVFVTPMERDLGWSRSSLTGAYSLALLISAVAGLAVGQWLDRSGPRLLMTGGSCAAALLVLAWAGVHSLPVFYLIWAALGLVMAAVLYEPAFWVVAAWFPHGRGRPLTVLTFIAGFSSVIYIPLAGALVRAEGWRSALVTLAIILAVGTIPFHALVLRGRPLRDGAARAAKSDSGDMTVAGAPPLDGTRLSHALRMRTFWLLAAAFILNSLGTGALIVHLVPLLVGRGNSLAFATTAAGLVGLAALPGRLIFTPLGDHVRRTWVTSLIFLTQALAFVALLLLPGVLAVVGYVLLFGLGFGAVTPARAALVADLFGRAHYGKINSAIALFMTLGRALGPVAVGILYDTTHRYSLALSLLTCASLLAAATALLTDLPAEGWF